MFKIYLQNISIANVAKCVKYLIVYIKLYRKGRNKEISQLNVIILINSAKATLLSLRLVYQVNFYYKM